MLLLGLLALLAFGGASTSVASAALIGQITIDAQAPPPPAKPSGSASQYEIGFTCEDTDGDTCGTEVEIRIPLVLSAPVNPETPPMTGWTYAASSSDAGLILSQTIDGNDLVLKLDPTKIEPGDSRSVILRVTPPNFVTPDDTTWSLRPTLEINGSAVAQAPTPALGAASAETDLSVTKVTHDGSSFIVRGNNVIFNITAQCNAGGPTGSLYMKRGSLVDALPAGLTYVSATPAPTSHPTVGATGTITWDFSDPADLPPGCAGNAGGVTNYQVIAAIDDPNVANLDELENAVTFEGTPIGTGTAIDTTAKRKVTVYDVSPTDPGTFFGKSSAAPLQVQSLGFKGTYPGNWMPNIGNAPSVSNPASAPGRFTSRVEYDASGAYTTDLVDPMPCLDNPSPANRFNSKPVTPPALPAELPDFGTPCANPAFHPTVVRVNAPSLNAAHTAGWRPTGVTTGGVEFDLTPLSGSGATRYYAVPPAHDGDVAVIWLKKHTALRDAWLQLDIFGYADASTEGGEILHNVASASAYPTTGGANPTTGTDDADILIEEQEPQLGVYKSFGAYGNGGGGTTTLSIIGRVATTTP